MSFIAKNPLSLPEIKNTPSTPSGTRGLFAKEDGFYEVDSFGEESKISTNVDRANSYKYYGDAGIIPSDQDLFNFEIDKTNKTAKIVGEYQEFDGYIPAELSGDIVIPYEYRIVAGDAAGVYKVTEISEYSLHFSNIISIQMPNTVTKIGDYALQGCENLTKVTLPNTITKIGNYAFYNCKNLTSIAIPDSVTTIGTYAFQSCKKLTEITFPSRVQIIGDGVCAENSSLSWVYFDKSPTGQAISSIPKNAFKGCNIVSITIPYGVTVIKEGAFYGNAGLSNITLPESLRYVYSNAFERCNNISDIWYEGSEESWGKISFATGNDIFNGTHSGTSIHYKSVTATEGYVDEQINNISIASKAVPVQTFINLLGGAKNWVAENVEDASGNVIGVRYGQVVNVNNAVITPNSKVDLQITSEQMVIFYEKDLAFVAENDNGVVTVYCIGQIPLNDYEIYATVTEVVTNG